MKNVIVVGVAALALVGCGAKEEVAAPEAAPEVEAPVAPGAADAPAAADASVVEGEVPAVEAPVVTSEPKIG